MTNTLLPENFIPTKQFKITLIKHGLKTTEFVMLKSILELSTTNKHIIQTNICDYTNTKPMTISLLIRKLILRKLVQRQEHPIDARAKVIQLTSTGTKIITEVLNDVNFTTK